MDRASDEHESSAEERPLARGPRPLSSRNRAAEARAQQHFENIRNEGHSRTHIGNAYNTYHITERRHELQQETQGITLKEALAFPLMRYRHDAIAAAYEGSCEWLFQTPAYNRWCDQTLQGEHYGLWWITGSPGTGKSTILKELLKRSYASRRDVKTISYFFDANVEGLQSTAKGMYQSLLFQMVKDSPHLQTSPNSEVLRDYRSGEWPLERLKELFRDVISSLEHTSVACYIDAVDESQDDTGDGGSSQDILQDFEELAVFAYRNFLTIHICISSRISSNTLLHYSERLILDNETGHITGIQKWAFARLGLGYHDLKSTLAQCIASSACGGYRWAKELIAALKKDGDFEDQLRLLNKLAMMIATTKVPMDRSRLEELQSSLAKIWLNPAQTNHINAQSEARAVSDATTKSVNPSTQPDPGQVPPYTGRSTPSNVAARATGAQDVRARFGSNTRQQNANPKPSNTIICEDSQSSGSGRMASGPKTRPTVPRAHSTAQSTKEKETPDNTRELYYRPRERLSQDSKGPADQPRVLKRQSQTPTKHPLSLSAGSTPLPEQKSSTANSSSPNQKREADILPRSRKARVLESKSAASNPTHMVPAVMTRDAQQSQFTSLAGPDTTDGPSRRGGGGHPNITSLTSAQRSTTDTPGAEYADKWFFSIRQHAHALFDSAPPRNKDWKPVRVAIIDSGLTLENEHADVPMASELRRMISSGHITYTDCAGSREPYIDSSEGLQGTWCALLLLQVAPHAKLYIANVVKRGEKAPMPDHVAAAIAWAIENEVDMINMSFGWNTVKPEVNELIDAARRKGILIFSAASNDSGFGRQHGLYPASHPMVHGIHSWCGPGYSSGMNPQAFRDRSLFTFPGDQVAILTDTHQPFEDTGRRSGTAFATSIATGSAALVLQLARQQLTVSIAEEEVERRLRHYEGISEVFRAMSGEPSADGYYHVEPWTLLGMYKPAPTVGVNESHQWLTLMRILRNLGRFGKFQRPGDT